LPAGQRIITLASIAGRSTATLGLLALLATPGTAFAALGCTISTIGVAFGIYDPTLSTPDDSNGSVDVTCFYTGPGGADATNYTVALSTGSSGTYVPRRLTAGASLLTYNLFRDAGRSQIWGNGTAGTSIVTGNLKVGPGAGNNTRTANHPVYGRIPAQQDADSGNYSDTILVTLTF
jgi:spore coat protein U-like protein